MTVFINVRGTEQLADTRRWVEGYVRTTACLPVSNITVRLLTPTHMLLVEAGRLQDKCSGKFEYGH